MRKLISIVAALGMVTIFAGCGQAKTGDTEVYVFAAASLSRPMADLEASYEQNHPGVDIIVNADSSGVLMTQIEEGSTCDIFFSAGAKANERTY
jgi:ABC-type molybdate transport system, periplasmic component